MFGFYSSTLVLFVVAFCVCPWIIFIFIYRLWLTVLEFVCVSALLNQWLLTLWSLAWFSGMKKYNRNLVVAPGAQGTRGLIHKMPLKHLKYMWFIRYFKFTAMSIDLHIKKLSLTEAKLLFILPLTLCLIFTVFFVFFVAISFNITCNRKSLRHILSHVFEQFECF